MVAVTRLQNIRRLVRRRCLILDGATGTELQRRGLPAGACPETWCLDHPEEIRAIHKEYAKAGSDIIYTCTFGANRLKLAQYGRSEVREINRELALLARVSVGRKVMVAGDIGPTGYFVEPFGELPFEEAVAVFREQIDGLVSGGVDLLVIETMMDIQEARAALIAAREGSGLFTMATMTFEKGGRTLNGTDAAAALVTLQSLGAHAVGCNCSTGPSEMMDIVKSMSRLRRVPLVAKPNAGMPRLQPDGTTVFSMTPEEFAGYGKTFVSLGVGLMGGCCGTTPDHIAALKEDLRGAIPPTPVRGGLSAVSSARKALVFEDGAPLLIIGERINPTGKTDLQKELRSGRTELAARMARDQERQGADLLDVNVGVPGIDQKETAASVIKTLSVASMLPLVVDSTDPAVIERSLRIYPGRALINSVSGGEDRMEAVLETARHYGAMFILLPLTSEGVPGSFEERKAAVRSIYERARQYGFTKADIIIDGLVMTVASNPDAPAEVLKTIEWASRSFHCRTLLGLSNVSFGLPERKWINGAFLAMAQSRGLTVAIANPADEELMHLKAAGDVLTGRDPDAAAYCSRFSTDFSTAAPVLKQALSLPERITRAVIEGSRSEIRELLKMALDAGEKPQAILSGLLIPAITEVGDMYEKRQYFLPQLIAAAETMQEGVAFLEPFIERGGGKDISSVAIVMATVEGDIHDIGKNIVALMLRNQGYTVIDLGKDVSAHRIIEEASRSKADLVGLSALMTTTMTQMEKTVLQARREGLKCPFLVGGAVVTPSWAESIGARYAKDGVEAVRVVGELLKKKESD